MNHIVSIAGTAETAGESSNSYYIPIVSVAPFNKVFINTEIPSKQVFLFNIEQMKMLKHHAVKNIVKCYYICTHTHMMSEDKLERT